MDENKRGSDFCMVALWILQCVSFVFACVVGTVFSWRDMGAWCLVALMIPYSITISTICEVVKRIKKAVKEKNGVDLGE